MKYFIFLFYISSNPFRVHFLATPSQVAILSELDKNLFYLCQVVGHLCAAKPPADYRRRPGAPTKITPLNLFYY